MSSWLHLQQDVVEEFCEAALWHSWDGDVARYLAAWGNHVIYRDGRKAAQDPVERQKKNQAAYRARLLLCPEKRAQRLAAKRAAYYRAKEAS